MPKKRRPLVAILMGSRTDLQAMRLAEEALSEFQVPFETRVISAHRSADRLFAYAEAAERTGLECIIAGAGGAAHLPGLVAAKTVLPVVGVPIPSTSLLGMDSLLSIVQMPRGTPVATMAIGAPGAFNAGLFAVAVLGSSRPPLRARLQAWRRQRAAELFKAEVP